MKLTMAVYGFFVYPMSGDRWLGLIAPKVNATAPHRCDLVIRGNLRTPHPSGLTPYLNRGSGVTNAWTLPPNDARLELGSGKPADARGFDLIQRMDSIICGLRLPENYQESEAVHVGVTLAGGTITVGGKYTRISRRTYPEALTTNYGRSSRPTANHSPRATTKSASCHCLRSSTSSIWIRSMACSMNTGRRRTRDPPGNLPISLSGSSSVPAPIFVMAASGPSIRHPTISSNLPLRSSSSFRDQASFYRTELHEIYHWAGRASCLGRRLGKRLGESAYAMEDLIAEMGAAFLAAHRRLEGVIFQKVMGVFFNEIVRRMVKAFEDRAHELYGAKTPPKTTTKTPKPKSSTPSRKKETRS